MNKMLRLTIVAALLALAPFPSMAMTAAEQKKMLDQLDQLDKLDHMDFLDLEEKANVCIRARNFDCADKKIAKAAKAASNPQDKAALRSLKQKLASERNAVSEERAEARRQEELEAQREEARRREERAEEARQAKRENAQWAANLANDINKDMTAFSANMAEENKKTQRLYDQAVNQRAQEQREADRRVEEQNEARQQKALAERAALERQISARREGQAQQTYTQNTPQNQTPSRKELQAQLDAKQAAHNAQEQQLQQQAQQQASDRIRNHNTISAAAPVIGTPGGAASGSGAQKKKESLGPEQLEAVAVCWQSTKKKDIWWCDGPIQITILGESLESNLGYAGCNDYRATDGDRTITLKSGSAVTARVFLCGWGLWTDYDVVKKYGITVQRNKYQCVNGPKSHCKENYQLVN